MGRSCSFLLLLFLLPPWPRATVALLQYRHDCGELGMQLLVFPPHGRTVRFKVLGEWGDSPDPLGVLDFPGIPLKPERSTVVVSQWDEPNLDVSLPCAHGVPSRRVWLPL